MRKRFEVQYELGTKPIEETPVFIKSRDDFPPVVAALLAIYTNRELNSQIFSILEDKILAHKKRTGREGMNLWQIFVLAQVRLALNIDYDRLEMMVNSNSVLRQLLGIERESSFGYKTFHRQTIIDNVNLLDDETLKKLNDVIVQFGHKVFKKKETEALRLRTDSFVVESNVHFPTDYNLLWDSARKSLDIVYKFMKKYPQIEGWRKINDWYKTLKTLSRALGKASASRGIGKKDKVKKATENYLKKAKSLEKKLKETQKKIIISDMSDVKNLYSLEYFIPMLTRHIDLVYRRLIKEEKIQHEEKMFSIFETYTEWISKGKINREVELGKRLSITTDQYGLIVDYYLHEKQTDSEVVLDIAISVLYKYIVDIWSFDKGYWHKINKELLQTKVRKVVMPKKGKPNLNEKAEESQKEFKKFRHKHSAVESNINELEHRGLGRCPNRGYASYKRHIGIGITAYNLHKIGKELLAQEREKEKRTRVA